MKEFNILGVVVTDHSLTEAVSLYREFSNTPALNTISYVTSSVLMSINENESEKIWFDNLDMTICAEPIAHDGNEEVTVSNMDGKCDDFLETVLRNMSASGAGIYLVSGSEETLAVLKESLKRINDRIVICGERVYKEEEQDSMYNEINCILPGMIISCMNWKIQGELMMEAKRFLTVPVWLGIIPSMLKSHQSSGTMGKISLLQKILYRRKLDEYNNNSN